MCKWRSDKNRLTVAFKLQFHATQVSEHGMVISVIPAENGKPIAKLEKSTVKTNACYWETPVYVTVKFLQDPKTSKIQERIYYFLISNGLPKGTLIGDCCVNMADYIAATKPCSISFPFKNSNSEFYLHVSIQRIQENTTFSTVQRDLGDNECLRIKQDDKSLRRYLINGDVEQEGTQLNSFEDQLSRNSPSHSFGLNGSQRSSNGSDITSSISNSSSGSNSPRESGVRNGTIHNDQILNSSGYQDHQKREWELSILPFNYSSTDYSLINNSPRDFLPNFRSSMCLDNSVNKLRAELVAMSRRAELSDLELQSLRKQIVKESKKGHDLLREISSLKEERDFLKDECVKLKAFHECSKQVTFEGDPHTLIKVIREELTYEKEVNTNLRLELQKTRDSNKELILLVHDLEEKLAKNCKGVFHLPNGSLSGESGVETEDNILCSEIEMYRREKDELEMQIEQLALDYEILRQENHELNTKLEQNHLQEELNMQCEGSSSFVAMNEYEIKENDEELSCYLEEIRDLQGRNNVLENDMDTIRIALNESKVIINELESVIVKLKKESTKYIEERSNSLTFMKELETRNHNLEKELEKKRKRYEVKIEALVHEKMELETHIQNLIRYEAGLKKDEPILSIEKKSEDDFGKIIVQKDLNSKWRNVISKYLVLRRVSNCSRESAVTTL